MMRKCKAIRNLVFLTNVYDFSPIFETFLIDNRTFSNQIGYVKKSFSRTYGPLLQFRFRTAIGKTSPLLKLELCVPTAIRASMQGIQFYDSSPDPFSLLKGHLLSLKANNMVTVLMLRSGRFAGAVFDFDANKGCSQMLVHKVFRRYTVRAKAGGGQSSHDNKVRIYTIKLS